jgi:PAS domain S-box-containing protein
LVPRAAVQVRRAAAVPIGRWTGKGRFAVRATTKQPTGVERTFGDEEIIVSKTDTKGFITYANDVFLRVSGYEETGLVGKPHNVIRHPAMPRCVFKLLWDTIANGDEIFAYVLNMAADGAEYWVFAHVTPSFGPRGEIVGYHSNRRSPDRGAVERIAGVYAALLAEEQRHTSPTAGMDASTSMLLGVLEERGQSYDEFVWSLAEQKGAVR